MINIIIKLIKQKIPYHQNKEYEEKIKGLNELEKKNKEYEEKIKGLN